MNETKARDLVGTRRCRATVVWLRPVGEGETGWDTEYEDDEVGWHRAVQEVEGRDFPNGDLARAWAARRAAEVVREHPGGWVDHLRVEVVRWDADDFDDPVCGLVLDAVEVTESRQYGYLVREGALHWDEPEVEVRR